MEIKTPKVTPEQQPEQTADSQRQRLMPEPRSSRNAWIFGIIAAAVIIAGAGGYYWYTQKNQPQPITVVPEQITTEPEVIPEHTSPATYTGQALPTVPTSADYKVSGMVEWQKPAKIASVKEFDSPEASVEDKKLSQAYVVGTFISGPYEGADFLVVQPGCDCPGGNQFMARVARQDGKYIVLGKYSDPFYTAEADSSTPPTKFTVDTKFSISDLEYPVSINGSDAKQELHLEAGYPFYQPFIKSANVITAFSEPKLGQVYTNIVPPDFDLDDQYFRRNGFYINGPDGGLVTYSVVIDFVGTDNVPQVTWTGGQKNTKEYMYKAVGGCGASNLADVVSPKELAMKDLALAGTTSKGDKVYVNKDPNHPIPKSLYDDSYYVPEGQTKLSYSDYIKAHPLFFWVDSFDRIIKFENSQFLPQAECGKPVIYLYPQQRQEISVQLAPQGGFSYTEPAYNNGWNVMAEPSGVLTDLASNKQYPYLFWEGQGAFYQTPDKGFVVARADVPSFLSAKLRLLGLNDKESADFKEFWQPKMDDSPYYFVTFMGNETMNQIAPLSITPKPDTVIRVLMDFKPLQKRVSVSSYPIKTPVRRGFTVVEWGGVLR